MLDDRMRMMLEAANTLTEEDLEFIRSDGKAVPKDRPNRPQRKSAQAALSAPTAAAEDPVTAPPVTQEAPGSNSSRGAYERKRTRESKVSTECLGEERIKHDWWPLGTEVVGQIGTELFTAVVVENAGVKSNRSLKLTSGPAQGRICNTPTRAAIEATESYRGAHNLGRGGGVTNGWMFWQPRTGSTV